MQLVSVSLEILEFGAIATAYKILIAVVLAFLTDIYTRIDLD
ncbi:MAG: hypothetical protein ACI9OH_000971 [Oleispira sp.]|jgi:hypothetical protein